MRSPGRGASRCRPCRTRSAAGSRRRSGRMPSPCRPGRWPGAWSSAHHLRRRVTPATTHAEPGVRVRQGAVRDVVAEALTLGPQAPRRGQALPALAEVLTGTLRPTVRPVWALVWMDELHDDPICRRAGTVPVE